LKEAKKKESLARRKDPGNPPACYANGLASPSSKGRRVPPGLKRVASSGAAKSPFASSANGDSPPGSRGGTAALSSETIPGSSSALAAASSVGAGVSACAEGAIAPPGRSLRTENVSFQSRQLSPPPSS